MNSNQTHVRSHTKTTNIQRTVNFYCNRESCRKGFETSGKLELHHRIHDNNLIKCYFCSWAGAAHINFVNHMNHHFHVRPIKCSYCSDSFYKSHARVYHEERFHEQIMDKYKCPMCDFASYNMNMIQKHKQKIHTVKQHTFTRTFLNPKMCHLLLSDIFGIFKYFSV